MDFAGVHRTIPRLASESAMGVDGRDPFGEMERSPAVGRRLAGRVRALFAQIGWWANR